MIIDPSSSQNNSVQPFSHDKYLLSVYYLTPCRYLENSSEQNIHYLYICDAHNIVRKQTLVKYNNPISNDEESKEAMGIFNWEMSFNLGSKKDSPKEVIFLELRSQH